VIMKRIFLLCISIPCSIAAFDLNHFFQAAFAPQEPRFEEPCLTSLALRAGLGSTCIRTDRCGVSIPQESHYSVKRVVFDAAYNYRKNLFFNVTLPFYRINIREKNVCSRFNSVGNLALTTGWTINYEETEELDFIDATIETGIIAPTAKFPLNTTGIPLRGVAAVGLYDWITMGIAADIVVFFKNNYGRLWDVSIYGKADHVVRGLSLLLGFTHSDEKQVPVPWSKTCERLPFWTMNTFHLLISYDTACWEHPYFPRFEFFYNKVLDGKNIIKTPLWGFAVAADF
jgi:hypothetical protein